MQNETVKDSTRREIQDTEQGHGVAVQDQGHQPIRVPRLWAQVFDHQPHTADPTQVPGRTSKGPRPQGLPYEQTHRTEGARPCSPARQQSPPTPPTPAGHVVAVLKGADTEVTWPSFPAGMTASAGLYYQSLSSFI